MAARLENLVVESVRRSAVKGAETALADGPFWYSLRKIWFEHMTPMAREIFDAGVDFARTVKPRHRRHGLRGLTDRLFGRKADFLDPDPEVLDNIAGSIFETYMDDWWSQLERPMRDALRQAIQRAAESGGGTRQVIDEIAPWFGPERAQRIGVTETTRLFGQGAVATYQASGVQRWEWQTSEDDHVCPECEDLDGQQFDIDEIFDPAHVSCRCFPVAVIE